MRRDEIRKLIRETVRAVLKEQGAVAEWLTIQQAAALLGCSRDHINRAVVTKELPAANIGKNERPTYRIKRADLDAWMESRKNEKTTSRPVSRHFRRL